MAGTVVDVLARLRADSSNMVNGFGQAEKAAKGFSTKSVAMGSAIGTALGTVATQAAMAAGRAMVSFVGDSVNAARDINETISKVGVIFGDQASAIQEFAGTAATSLGLSKQAAMDAASTFATFGKGAGLAGGDLTNFSTELTGLSSDLASFYNTSPEQAINAIGSALRGESEPIRKYGILLDDATLRQSAMKLGIVSTTKNALTPQQRVLAAHAVIMEKSADAQGDFARTSGGLANQQRILAAQISNVKTTFGQALLPVVLSVTTAFTTKVIPAVQKLAGWMSTNLGPSLEKAMGAFKGLFGTASGGSGILTALQTYVQGIGNAFTTYIQPALTAVMPKLMTLFGVIQQNVLPAFNALVGFFAGQVFPTLAKLSGGIISIVGIFAEKLAPVIKAASGFIQNNLVPALTEIFKKAQPVINTIVELGKDLATIAGSIIGFVAPIIMKLAGFLIAVLKPAFKVIITVIGAVLKVIGALVKGVKNIGTVFSIAKDMAIGAFNLLMAGIGKVVNGIIDIFNGLIKAWNLVPFHDDVDEISHVTMPKFAKATSKATAAATTGLEKVTTASKATKKATEKTTTATEAATAATEANAAAADEAAKKAEENAKKRTEAVATMKDLMKVQFGQPSELRKALSGADASVDSIISTYGKLEQAINDRFAGLNAKGADKMVSFLKEQTSALVQLAKSRELVVKEIEKAQEKLTEIMTTRLDFSKNAKSAITSFGASMAGFYDQAIKEVGKTDMGKNASGVRSVVSSFSETGAQSADAIVKSFRDRLATSQSFAKNIKQLTNSGLNQNLVESLIGLSPEEGAAVSKSIIDGGQGSIDALNAVQKDLDALSTDFGDSLASKFYGQAVTQAEEYLNGWKAKQASIDTAMSVITSGVEAQLNLLTKGSGSIGMAAIDALIAGLKSKEAEAIKLAKNIYDQVQAALNGKSTIAAIGVDVTPKPSPTPVASLGAKSDSAASVTIGKGAVNVTINGTDSQFGSNTPWAQASAALATEKAMEEALILAAKKAANARRAAL